MIALRRAFVSGTLWVGTSSTLTTTSAGLALPGPDRASGQALAVSRRYR